MNHKNVECPADSSVHIVHPFHITNSHSTANINKHTPTAAIDAAEPISLTDMHKRSINSQSNDEASSLPSAERHARQLADAFDDSEEISNNNDIIARCCPKEICKCKPCVVSRCGFNETLEIVEYARYQPGHCCDKSKCVKRSFCGDDYGNRVSNGATWTRATDECTTCHCIDGDTRCFSSACRPLSCKKTIKVRGECCPKCDLSDSEFCEGHELCDIACRYDHVKTVAGCKLCLCVQLPTTTSTTDAPTEKEATEKDELTTEIVQDNITFNKTNEEYFYSLTTIILVVLIGLVFFAGLFCVVCQYTRRNVYRNVPLSDTKRSKIKEITCTANCLPL